MDDRYTGIVMDDDPPRGGWLNSAFFGGNSNTYEASPNGSYGLNDGWPRVWVENSSDPWDYSGRYMLLGTQGAPAWNLPNITVKGKMSSKAVQKAVKKRDKELQRTLKNKSRNSELGNSFDLPESYFMHTAGFNGTAEDLARKQEEKRQAAINMLRDDQKQIDINNYLWDRYPSSMPAHGSAMTFNEMVQDYQRKLDGTEETKRKLQEEAYSREQLGAIQAAEEQNLYDRMNRLSEPGLQGVYPEFELLTGGRALANGAAKELFGAAAKGLGAVQDAGYKVLTNPYVDSALASLGGAYSLDKMRKGETDTLLDKAEIALGLLPFAPAAFKGTEAVNNGVRNASKAVSDFTKSNRYKDTVQGLRDFASGFNKDFTTTKIGENAFGVQSVWPDGDVTVFDRPHVIGFGDNTITTAPGLVSMGGNGPYKGLNLGGAEKAREGAIDDLKELMRAAPEGTAFSGDAKSTNLGTQLIEDFRNVKPVSFFKHLFTNTSEALPPPLKGGMSPDAMSMLYRMAKDEPDKFHISYGTTPAGDFNWLSKSGGRNAHIYDAQEAYKDGLLTADDYVNTVNRWLEPLGGRPAEVVNGVPKVWQPFLVRGGKTPKITAENASIIPDSLWDAAYREAVESGNRPEALRLLELRYLNSGIPKSDLTVTPSGEAVGWYHGSPYGNHTVFDSSRFNATIGGESAQGKVKGNFLTRDVPAAARYANAVSKFERTTYPEFTSPKTKLDKIKNLFGLYKPRKLYPAEMAEMTGAAPKPDRLYDNFEGDVLDLVGARKADQVVYPLYVNPGENPMIIDFQGNPWSKSPIEFPNHFSVNRYERTGETFYPSGKINPTIEKVIVPFKDKQAAVDYYNSLKDRFGKRYVEDVSKLEDKKFPHSGGTREVEMFSSGPTWERAELQETHVPNTTNGAVQTAAKNENTSVYMKNVRDSNGGEEGVLSGGSYPIDDLVTFKPSQQKIADITYDENGNLIPISKRFNWNIENLKYGIVPYILGGLGTAGYLYGSSNSNDKIQ